MKLIRLVTVYLDSKEEKWKFFKMNVGDVIVRSFQSNIVEKSGKQQLTICAEKTLKYKPKISKDNVLAIPKKDRRELETILHFVGNLLSISEFVSRSISSPTPCVLFAPETPDELDFLNSTEGIEMKPTTHHDFKFSLQDTITTQPLLDRAEGCEFIGLALSQNNVLGQLHEYIRFFERAFALTGDRLVDTICSFLETSDVAYTKDEIHEWIIDLRHGSTHADQRNKMIFEPDVRKSIVRIRQAAYDILFNKTKWHDSSITRRQSYTAPIGLLEDSSPYLTVGSPTSSGHMQLMDPYDTFPLDLSVIINSFPKESNWWFKKSGENNSIQSKEFPLRVFEKTDKKSKDTPVVSNP